MRFYVVYIPDTHTLKCYTSKIYKTKMGAIKYQDELTRKGIKNTMFSAKMASHGVFLDKRYFDFNSYI